MAELFGFKITRSKDEGESFTLPSSDDGTIEVAGGGFYSQTLDVDGRDKTENDLIRRYRDIAIQPECDSAIEDIVSEGIASNEYDAPVAVRLDRLEYSSKLKNVYMKSSIEFFSYLILILKDMTSLEDGMSMVVSITIR